MGKIEMEGRGLEIERKEMEGKIRAAVEEIERERGQEKKKGKGWRDEECKEEKREVRRSLREWRRSACEREEYRRERKEYKDMCNKKRREENEK